MFILVPQHNSQVAICQTDTVSKPKFPSGDFLPHMYTFAFTHPHVAVVFVWLCCHAPRPTQGTCWNCSLSCLPSLSVGPPRESLSALCPPRSLTWPANVRRPRFKSLNSRAPFSLSLGRLTESGLREVWSDLFDSVPLLETSEKSSCAEPFVCLRYDFFLSDRAHLTKPN